MAERQHRSKFWKFSSVTILYRRNARALTFENFFWLLRDSFRRSGRSVAQTPDSSIEFALQVLYYLFYYLFYYTTCFTACASPWLVLLLHELLARYRSLSIYCRVLLVCCRVLLVCCRVLLVCCRVLLVCCRVLLVCCRVLLVYCRVLLVCCRVLLVCCRVLLVYCWSVTNAPSGSCAGSADVLLGSFGLLLVCSSSSSMHVTDASSGGCL